ncbi:hypothetical protein SAMN02745866_00272 [Alteromonadaceae bacterium Bs31]|nr:hypothetical protein SAMN02745866_00272 [Alteromonadaceae bacterium Bs31]
MADRLEVIEGFSNCPASLVKIFETELLPGKTVRWLGQQFEKHCLNSKFLLIRTMPLINF